MILSMTGYGKSETIINNKKIIVEVKSLNSKNIDINTHIPSLFFEKELEIRALITERLIRGKVDICIKNEDTGIPQSAIINEDTINNYIQQVKTLSDKLSISQPVDIWSILCRLPGITAQNIVQELIDEDWQKVRCAIDEAISKLISFRQQEGEAVKAKFEQKLHNIAQYLHEVEPYEQNRCEKIKNQILSHFEELKIQYDSNRLEQEMIYYIEKLDINEEKQRLTNHLKYFADTMETNEAQGKKLGFIAQEMGREINTLGSKSNQAEMQNLVVKMKDELEQIKEQVLNVL